MHGYVKGISISAVTVEAKAVRQVQYAPLFTLSTNTPSKRMIMSVHCTIKSYQSIFCITCIMNTENIQHFVKVSLHYVFLFSYMRLGDLASSLAFLPYFDDWTVVWSHFLPISDLWVTGEQFLWEIHFCLFFLCCWVLSWVCYSVLSNIKISYFCKDLISVCGKKFKT